MTIFVNPLQPRARVLVSAVGKAEGSRGAAAALACAAGRPDVASLLIDIGGRVPRPTLIASAAAQQLEERLGGAHPFGARVAARGQVCQLALGADPEGLDSAAAAVTVARESCAVIHIPPGLLQEALAHPSLRPSAVLLRAELRDDRALVALVVRDLLQRGIAAGVLKRRLSWVAERRALFGALSAGSPAGIPERTARRLVETTS